MLPLTVGSHPPLLPPPPAYPSKLLKEVFQLWDNDGLNMVSRHSVLELLTGYYTAAPQEIRENLSDPQCCKQRSHSH